MHAIGSRVPLIRFEGTADRPSRASQAHRARATPSDHVVLRVYEGSDVPGKRLWSACPAHGEAKLPMGLSLRDLSASCLVCDESTDAQTLRSRGITR